MTKFKFLLIPLVASALSACAVGNALWQAEQSCIKYPTPSARVECEQKAKADDVAFEKEMKRREDQDRTRAQAEAALQSDDATPGDAKAPVKKKNELCFKRASGEMVCPN